MSSSSRSCHVCSTIFNSFSRLGAKNSFFWQNLTVLLSGSRSKNSWLHSSSALHHQFHGGPFRKRGPWVKHECGEPSRFALVSFLGNASPGQEPGERPEAEKVPFHFRDS